MRSCSLAASVLLLAPLGAVAHEHPSSAAAGVEIPAGKAELPEAPLCDGSAGAMGSLSGLPKDDFSHAPAKPHDPRAHYFTFDQLSHFYRRPGEFTDRLIGDEYGFSSLSFFVTETHPGGGPGLHVHDVEEAHVLLEGTAQYRVGDETFTVTGPYIAKVPAGTPHTFINAGTKPFRLVAVFASNHPNTRRIGPNPLVDKLSVGCAPNPPRP